MDSNILVQFDNNKKKIAEYNMKELKSIFDNTIFQYWFDKEYSCFKKNKLLKKTSCFAIKNKLLEGDLLNIYNSLYNQRNRLAHNTLSYQENTPTLKSLSELNINQNNYFVWIAILNLIDLIFMDLYGVYFDLLERYPY